MKKKKQVTILGILLLITLVIGISYAYWIFSYQQTTVNKLTSSCFSLSLTNELNDINLQDIYPISDEQGMNLEPFKFTVKNTCNTFASYTVSLEILDGSTLKSTYVKSQINRESPANLGSLDTTNTTIANSIESRILARGSLGSEDEEDYTVRLWMDKDTQATSDSMNKTFTAKIVITGQPSNYSPVENGITTLSDAMLANEYQTTVDIAKQKIAAKNNPDFSKTAPIIIWQETIDSSEIEINADMPHPNLNGNASLGGQNLTESSQKIILGKSYTFNKDYGNYTLQDRIEVDPTTITDYAEKNYYYCSASTSIDATTGVVFTSKSYANCTYIYKVNSVTVSNVGTENTNGYRRRYTLSVNKLGQVELESDKSDKGLYQTQDDLGTSYYYRGSTKNNFVKFAGFYWRIIRRNGDDTVRLIYNGPNANQTGSNTHIDGLSFNTQKDNPAHVGYMYGNSLNTSYEQTHANEINSTIKDYLESWYEQHLSAYDTYIADGIFCNDRSLSTTGSVYNGYLTDKTTDFGATERLYSKKEPTLKCPQQNDKFTVSEALGNAKNAHPIGLITADELSVAGAVNGKYNRLFYLFTGHSYWTMSTGNFYSGNATANVWHFQEGGDFVFTNVILNHGIRAVINLKSNTEITGGIGTANEPFVIKNAT